MREYAAVGQVSAEVSADFQAIQRAKDRGELRGFRYVRVERRADGSRRVVSADAPGLSSARSTADRGRRLAQIERELRLAQTKLALDRDQRLVQVEAELAQARALRTGPSAHFSIETYRARPYSGPFITSVR